MKTTAEARNRTSPNTGEETVYVRRDLMTDDGIACNAARLRREAEATLKHAAVLEAWGKGRGR